MSTVYYDAAYELVEAPSAFAATNSLPHPAPVLFRLTGMDEPLAWPLCAAQAARIAALYPDKVISAAHIHFEDRYLGNHDHMLNEIDRVCFPHLAPSSEVFIELSHMVVDDVGDADSFRLLPSDDDEVNETTFGILIVLLPSAHTGGVITLTYGNHSETFDHDTSLLETAVAAAFLSTTISSAPITSGRRVALVYRLLYGEVDEPMRMEPIVQDAAVAAFQALGQSTTQEVQRLGLILNASRDALNFAALPLWESEFVKVLLAAGNFDAGLAKVSLEWHKMDVVEAFKPHPACNIPDAVVDGLIGQTLQGFLHNPSLSPEVVRGPSNVLVFWPKRHRVCLACDIGGVLDFLMLRLARGNDDDDGYLGISDTRELLLCVMPYFGIRGPSLDKPQRMSYEEEMYVKMHKDDLSLNLRRLEKTHQLLMSLDDVAVSAVFIDTIEMGIGLSVAKVAPVVHGLLSQHGWGPLESSMLQLVQRWLDIDADATLQLLTSLAGLDTDSPVCPPLRQPLEAELFKRCYDVVLSTLDLFTKPKNMLPRGPAFVKSLFLLEHYVTTTAPQLQDANYASQRLPLILVPVIDAYLFAFPPTRGLFFSSAVWHPLKDLAVGLASAVRCEPSLPLPSCILDNVLWTIRSPMARSVKIDLASCHADVAAAVLVLASLSQRLDASLVDTLVNIYGLQLLPIIASIASQLPDDAIVADCVVGYIDNSVPALVDDSHWPKPFNTYDTLLWMDVKRHDEIPSKGAPDNFGADVVVSAVELLQRFAPDTVVAYATRWLESLPTTLDVLHDRLLPVLSRLDRHSGVFSHLLKAMLDLLADELVLPTILNFALAPPTDLDPDHCDQCRDAHAFLLHADKATMMLYTNPSDVCTNLTRIIDADTARLRLTTAIGSMCSLEKVRQPGQVSQAEWHVHETKVQIHARITACIATLTRQAGDEQDDAIDKLTEPPAKRVRRS